MVIRITVEVDEDRLREAGTSIADEDVMAELEALRRGRLNLQTRGCLASGPQPESSAQVTAGGRTTGGQARRLQVHGPCGSPTTRKDAVTRSRALDVERLPVPDGSWPAVRY